MAERILIEGVGGIGGVVAARMIQAGYGPTLVTNNEEITRAINTGGLRINSPEGVAVVRARAYTRLDEIGDEGPFDVAFLIMKANSVVEAAQATVPLLAPEGFVVTCQNGIVEDAVGAAIGDERVLAAIIVWGGTMHAPGVYERTSIGPSVIGERDGSITDRVRLVERLLQTATPVVVTQNIRGAQWSKLAINCTITTIGALTGDYLGVMLEDRRVRLAFMAAYAEVINTAQALGIQLEKVVSNPMILYVPPDAAAPTRFAKDLALRFVGRKYRRLKSSSLQSLERGRKTEIDFLNGYVVEQAQKVGVATPVNARLVQLIKEIESGQRPIARSNLDDLFVVVPALR
ncbi:MAG: ketopantoate reductase family protein [Chloroflexota bacterium]